MRGAAGWGGGGGAAGGKGGGALGLQVVYYVLGVDLGEMIRGWSLGVKFAAAYMS